jgi:hypothetical protein
MAEILEDAALDTAWSVGWDQGRSLWECKERAGEAEMKEAHLLLAWRAEHGMTRRLFSNRKNVKAVLATLDLEVG